MSSLLQFTYHFLLPHLPALCSIAAWWLVAIALLSIYQTLRKGIHQVRRLHQIPCPNCQFFTNDYRLKCTVHPEIANSDTALSCPDFCPQRSILASSFTKKG